MDDEESEPNLVSADVVEVACVGVSGEVEETALAAAQAVYEIMSSMVKSAKGEMGREEKEFGGKDEL